MKVLLRSFKPLGWHCWCKVFSLTLKFLQRRRIKIGQDIKASASNWSNTSTTIFKATWLQIKKTFLLCSLSLTLSLSLSLSLSHIDFYTPLVSNTEHIVSFSTISLTHFTVTRSHTQTLSLSLIDVYNPLVSYTKHIISFSYSQPNTFHCLKITSLSCRLVQTFSITHKTYSLFFLQSTSHISLSQDHTFKLSLLEYITFYLWNKILSNRNLSSSTHKRTNTCCVRQCFETL